MARFPYKRTATDGYGYINVGASILVNLTGTSTAATIYESESGSVISNSIVTSDNDGRYEFWVDEDDHAFLTQRFRTVISKQGFSTQTNDDVVIFPATSADAAASSAAASAAAALVSENNAATSETNADTDATATAADVVLTNADVVLTGLDVVSTNADVVLTNADVVLTGLDVTAAAASASAASTSETNAATSAATIPTVFSTTADPTANSDASNTDTNGNFAVNSQWTNTTTNETFTCKDSTATAAIWHGDQGTEGATIADSGTPDIFNNGGGDTVHLAGTTTITDFPDAPRVGMWRKIIFDGARTLTHGAAAIVLPGAANITTAVGDFAFVYADTVSLFRVAYFKADGTPIVGGGVFTVSYTSAEQTITTAGLLTLAHSLAVMPTLVQARLVCQTAELGYSIGDEIIVQIGAEASAAADNYGIGVELNSTNVLVRYGSAVNVFLIVNSSNGNLAGITTANWKLVMKAWA